MGFCISLRWNGIGDLVVVGSLLRGLASDHPGADISLYVNPGWLKWGQLFWDQVFELDAHTPQGKVYELGTPGLNEVELVLKEYMEDVNRHELWADACETQAIPYKIEIKEEVRAKARQFLVDLGLDLQQPILYFSPMTVKNRNWPLPLWHQLEKAINPDGNYQILIGTGAFREWASQEDFEAFNTPFQLGKHPPEFLLAVLEQVSLVVSNDSGFAHIGGLLNIPTVALCSVYQGWKVFGWYDSVHYLQAPENRIADLPLSPVVDLVSSLLAPQPN